MSRYGDIMPVHQLPERPVGTPAALGSLLKDLRARQGLTQAEVAKRAGVSRAFVIKLEDGHPRAELGRVLDVVRSLGVRLTPVGVKRDAEAEAVEAHWATMLGGQDDE